MHDSVLIVPGFNGSGPAHWQTWLESRVPRARRVVGIDWSDPVLDTWTEAILVDTAAQPGPVWLVAHSFGCLAAVCAIRRAADRVAGALLVAPADPERFACSGPRSAHPRESSISGQIPHVPLPCPSLVVASSNDPWLSTTSAVYWSEIWASRLVMLGRAGHINTESGFGPWPELIAWLRALRAVNAGLPLGELRALLDADELLASSGAHGADETPWRGTTRRANENAQGR